MALKGNKEMMTISLSPDTKERLKKYALQNRKSVSQAITDWIWGLPITDDKLETEIKEKTEVEEK